MSYNSETGWTRLTNSQLYRYFRSVEGRSDQVERRIEDAHLDYYWDSYGGLHARCSSDGLWELLSGWPGTFGDPVLDETATEPEWISVTDLGAVFTPAAATSTVLKLLREEGLLERLGGKDFPTAAAIGLYSETEAQPTSRFEHRPGAIQRRWAYDVVARLRARRSEIENSGAIAETELAVPARVMQIVVRFPAVCSRCDSPIELGATAEWNPATKALRCVACVAADPEVVAS